MDAIIEKYDQAWNTSDVDERRRLLEAALTDDCEMVEPRGRFAGRDAIFERISGFSDRFPGARVDITTSVDEHNGLARYGWRILDREEALLLDGMDVVERAEDGRLRRVLMSSEPSSSPEQGPAIVVAIPRGRNVAHQPVPTRW